VRPEMTVAVDDDDDQTSCMSTACDCYQLKTMTWKVAFGRPGGLVPCLPPRVFLAVRGLLLVVWTAVNVWAIYMMATKYNFPMQYFMTKLTAWTSILLFVYLGFACYATGMAQLSSRADGSGRETPWFVSIAWMLHTTNLVMQPLMSIMYFALVHEWGAERPSGTDAGTGSEARYSFEAVFVGHAFNSVLTTVDFLISRHVLKLAHFVLAVLFAASYIVFSILYYIAGGTNEDGHSPYIYPALDWRGFGNRTVFDDCSESTKDLCNSLTTRVVASLVVLLGVPAMSLCCFSIYLLRRRVRRRLEPPLCMPSAPASAPTPASQKTPAPLTQDL
jgi:hypothetical protein